MRTTQSLQAIVGADPGLRATLARARAVAPTRTPVLVTGESGTGKELLARLLHDLGPAPGGPFVAVNCGALARELAESELFGHERGSFTGASGRRSGWFEEADGGTLVLDEIGELPRDLQPKLLRVLETGRLRRVGGCGDTPVHVRIVAMTLRDLRREARQGTFRLDLFHRLSGFELCLPPLRQRPADIPALVDRFLAELGPELGPRTVDPGVMDRLVQHPWPGNVRELRNVVRRAAILTHARIDVGSLELESEADPQPARDLRLASHAADASRGAGYAADGSSTLPAGGASVLGGEALRLRGKTYDQLTREIFQWALREHGHSRRRAAHALGISRSTFCDRVKRLNLQESAC